MKDILEGKSERLYCEYLTMRKINVAKVFLLFTRKITFTCSHFHTPLRNGDE